MRILHTSDWHLGQSFFTQNRQAEHRQFFAWLLNTVEQRDIDAIIVSGDVFDTGTPPSYARELYNQFVVDLQGRQCALVVLGGNHDSVSMLNESRQLLSHLNTSVIASCMTNPEEQVIELKNKKGDIGALVCAIPFIRPRDVITSEAGQSNEQKKASLSEAIANHYAAVFQIADTHRKTLEKAIPIIATGHLTALGVSQSDSVREIYIGTLDGFSAEGFPPADYIALGHIHRPQKVAGKEYIRYSGSPIPLSFDELKRPKEVVLVEFDGQRPSNIEPLVVPRFQPMAVLKGSLSAIEQQLDTLDDNDKTVWLCIEVETDTFLTDLQQKVQDRVAGRNVDVLQLRRVRNPVRQTLTREAQETLAELTPKDVFDKRLSLLEDIDDEQRNNATRQFNAIVARVESGENDK